MLGMLGRYEVTVRPYDYEIAGKWAEGGTFEIVAMDRETAIAIAAGRCPQLVGNMEVVADFMGWKHPPAPAC